MDETEPAPYYPLDLRLTEESLDDLYDHAPCGYCSYLPDGTLVKLNQTLLDWLGCRREEVVARQVFPKLFTVGGWLHYETHCAPLLLLEGEVREVSYQLRGKDGHRRPVLLHARMVRDEANEPLVVRATLFDITERHRYEQALLQARTQAEAQQEQLRVQNERLERSVADLDSFVYAASHDLKQPIENMAGLFGELKQTATFADPEASHMLRLFEAALADILRTIAGLTEVVQQQRGAAPSAAAVELVPVLREVLGALGPQVRALAAEVTLDVAAAPHVRMAASSLRSVLYNLLSNALKYSVPGRAPRLRVDTVLAGDEVVLSIADNGRGIDLERHGNELFQLFRRFHPGVEGSGLGLYLANRLVQQAGGRMRVESAVDVGSTFRIELPH